MDRLTLNRRTVMVSAVAGTSVLLLGGSAGSGNAQVQSSEAGNIGYYRFQIGQIKATVLSDGLIGGPPTVYANDAPEAELQEVLRRAFLPTDHMSLQLNTLLLEVGGRRILLEAGAGATMGPNAGRVFDNLAAVGLGAGDIDTICPTRTLITSAICAIPKAKKHFPMPSSMHPAQIGIFLCETIPISPTCQ